MSLNGVCELLELLHQVGKQHGKPNAVPGHERSIRHVELFYHTPEGQIGMQAVMTKAGVFDKEVTANINQYNVPAVAPFNSCDPRINNGAWCALSRQHGSRSVADRLSHGWEWTVSVPWHEPRPSLPNVC